MKLSEAILLGSTVVAPKAGGQFYPEGQQGCALGMAAIARGCTFRTVVRPLDDTERRTLGVEGVWGSWILQTVERPCDCWRIWLRRRMRIKDIIAHLFDYHVMDKQNWTLERLVSWVETVEPKEVRPQVMPSVALERQAFVSPEIDRLKHEVEDWQAVRRAFDARHASRKRGETSHGLN